MINIDKILKNYKLDPHVGIQLAEEIAPYYINLNNGVMDLRTGLMGKEIEVDSKSAELFLATPDFVRKGPTIPYGYVVNADYIPKVKRAHPVFDRYVLTTFFNDYDTKNYIEFEYPMIQRLIYEIIGAALSDMPLKSLFLLIGETDSGKSVVLMLIKNLLYPLEVVSEVALGELSGKFYSMGICGKKLNICTEFGPKDIQDSATVIKKITSGETIRVEAKYYMPEYIKPHVKLLSAGNQLPDLKSAGIGALLNRFVVLNFPKSIPKEEQDPNMLERLMVEKDAIVSDSIDAFRELIARGGTFTQPYSTQVYFSQFIEKDPLVVVKGFVESCYDLVPGNIVSTASVLEKYREYLRKNALSCDISDNDVKYKIRTVYKIDKRKARYCGESVQCFVGLRPKEIESCMQNSSYIECATNIGQVALGASVMGNKVLGSTGEMSLIEKLQAMHEIEKKLSGGGTPGTLGTPGIESDSEGDLHADASKQCLDSVIETKESEVNAKGDKLEVEKEFSESGTPGTAETAETAEVSELNSEGLSQDDSLMPVGGNEDSANNQQLSDKVSFLAEDIDKQMEETRRRWKEAEHGFENTDDYVSNKKTEINAVHQNTSDGTGKINPFISARPILEQSRDPETGRTEGGEYWSDEKGKIVTVPFYEEKNSISTK